MTRIADLFCGGGGETRGIVQAAASAGLRLDLAAVNHWLVAIETHKLNFPDARSYCQDLATLNPLDVFAPRDRVDLLWASPECTHHSIARGGRPRSDQSRASAWLILKWLSELYVRRVIVENVPEFVSWGPLGADGKPLASKKGATFQAFVAALRAMGYTVEWQVLCAADYGDPTTRRRLFLQAARGGARILWPEPTHAREPGLFGAQPWRSAGEIIDWSIRGQSIFDRKRPLAPATLRRIEAGIRRYWGAWAEPFLLMLTHGGRVQSVDDPLATVTAAHRGEVGLVQSFLVPHYGERDGQEPRTHAIGEPCPTIPASGGGKFGLVEPFILHQDAPGAPRRVSDPVPAIRARNGHGLVRPFIVPYYGTSGPLAIADPLDTVTTRDRFALVDGEPYTLDITFRMLQPHELAAAQGFPVEHRFAGTKTDQVRQIGNAVPPGLARALTLSTVGAA
ncbi:MAG TPA: DNA cytosine methyltransferase [Coriobacteriia bacterium]|nr:DNA cytosine methyltransferase [Coriobacteriia bacterium]